RAANVVRQGYELNHPLQVVPADGGQGHLPQAASFVKLDASHVVLDTLKPSEDKQGVVIRLFESVGGRERVKLHFMAVPKLAQVTNLLEEPMESIDIVGNFVELDMLPYEVKTIKLIL
ncbi:MAG: alpha-mannosidase, partial [Bacilli bacterium]|nr:alpha-mannosidase [Bacilli bacterium]